MVSANANQPPVENQVNSDVLPDQVPQEEAKQPAAQEEPMDPELAQAIAMSLDPDFIANILSEMRRELMQNESLRAANTGVPIPP